MTDTINQIDRVKELLIKARHASMATVNDDGSPHNTPFMFLFDEDLKNIYWSSHPDSEHSKNLLRTGKAFIVIYDAIERGGLYIKVEEVQLLKGEELRIALNIHNKARLERGQDPLTFSYYGAPNPQRMWSAKTIQFWVNGAKRDKEGNVTRDIRIEIKRDDLV